MKEDTNPDEISQTLYGKEVYHEVLDSANISYPVSIERSLQILEEVDKLQNEIEIINNDRKRRHPKKTK